jgi:hypothetical protein
MLETTGKGQVIKLFRNIQASLSNSNFIKQGYAPGFVSKRVDGEDGILPNVYAYGNSDGEILENTLLGRADSAQFDNFNGPGNGNGRWTDTDGSGFEGEYFNFKTNGNGGNFGSGTESDFVWSDSTVNIDENDDNDLITIANDIFGPSPSEGETNSLNQPNRKSILYKTKELFKNGNISTMVNGHAIPTNKSQIQSAVLENGLMSKGNAALTKDALNGNFDNRANIYCRTWTPMDKYDQIADLVRHRKLDSDGGNYKRRSPLSEFSVLENTGFVKIARYVSDTGSVKRHMFSIENLAWMGKAGKPGGNPSLDLAPCEIGPFGGRIMWFPPYDIKFSESTSVNWDKHNFIGRGEPMYTYNNAERTGQLSFKIIIDHPNHLNVKNSTTTVDDDHYASFFAGCNPADVLSQNAITAIDLKTIPEVQTEPGPEILPVAFNVFFPNDNYLFPLENKAYESGLADVLGDFNAIIKTPIDGDKYIKNPDYNDYMGFSVTSIKDGYPSTPSPVKLRALSPLDPLVANVAGYNLHKINWEQFPNGEYLGLGMTINSDMVLSLVTDRYIDRTNFGLNANRFDNINPLKIPTMGSWTGWLAATGINEAGVQIEKSYLDALKEYTNHKSGPCKTCVIEIEGYASVQGSTTDTVTKNQELSDGRAQTIRTYLLDNVIPDDDPRKQERIVLVNGNGGSLENPEIGPGKECDANNLDQDTLACKLSRSTFVTFKLKPEIAKPASDTDATAASNIANAVNAVGKSFYKECDYFNKLSETDPFTFSKISDKIKYFSPAFHSTTPEGFNARLTFLQQCTRQGPSLYTNSSKPDNLVFGRPPVCVLRIGDFYYTKIIIENMSFDFEPLVWDLNPEGVGVQPMIANVSMNFAFIGGSSLDGPISRLQNALSSNYFANTGLFDTNAYDNKPSADAEELKNKDFNSNLYVAPQIPELPETDKALTSQDQDKKILEEGVLSLKYDDFGIFQGKVKGTFTVKSKLSKVYDVKLRSGQNDINVVMEYIDNQKLKLNELKVDFTSKNKTTNSLQRWDYHFTDVMDSENNIYKLAQESLDTYVKYTTIDPKDMDGKEADGWTKSFSPKLVDAYNYDFYIEVDELEYFKLFKGRWTPKFKVDRNTTDSTPVIDTGGNSGVVTDTKFTYSYTYEAYLSGGELAIINTKNETPDEEAKAIKKAGKENKAITKGLKKDKKATDKQAKQDKKDDIEKQKALVISGGGSLK